MEGEGGERKTSGLDRARLCGSGCRIGLVDTWNRKLAPIEKHANLRQRVSYANCRFVLLRFFFFSFLLF